MVVRSCHLAATATAPERVGAALSMLAAGSLPFWVVLLELRPLLDALTGDGVYRASWRLAYVAALYVATTWATGWLVGSVGVLRKVRVQGRQGRQPQKGAARADGLCVARAPSEGNQDCTSLAWKAFAAGACTGLYLFVYCLDYYGGLSSLRPLSFANGTKTRIRETHTRKHAQHGCGASRPVLIRFPPSCPLALLPPSLLPSCRPPSCLFPALVLFSQRWRSLRLRWWRRSASG